MAWPHKPSQHLMWPYGISRPSEQPVWPNCWVHIGLDSLLQHLRRLPACPVNELLENATESREKGIGGIKIKVGQPDSALDIKRVEAVRSHIGDFPLMIDANQQWERPTAQRMCRIFEQFNLVWIEEPLDCFDYEGHAALAAQFDNGIATGEMLTSAANTRNLSGIEERTRYRRMQRVSAE